MAFLSAKDEAAVRKEFERIGGPVKLTVFASELGGEHNGQTVALIQEVAALSDQLSVTVLNPHIERDQADGLRDQRVAGRRGGRRPGLRHPLPRACRAATSSPT